MKTALEVRDHIKSKLASVLAELGVTGVEYVSLEHPDDLAHGDYATGIALKYGKQLGQNPQGVAAAIIDKLGAIEGVDRAAIAGPGFINFTLSPEALNVSLEEARASAEWGRIHTLDGQQVLIEYTSPNLFKPLHIGNLVGNIIGESLSRLLESCGASVKRINYPSDIGLTVAKGVWGLKKLGADPRDIGALGEAYRAGNEAYETDAQAKTEIEAINKKLYEGSDPELSALRKTGIETSRAHLDRICEKLGTHFDVEIFESEASGLGRDTVLAHVEDGVFEKSDGAIIFPGEKYGLHTRVFINSAGLPTYEAKDIGNFELKQQRYPDWTQSIVVTGREQLDYFRVVIEAIKRVYPAAAQKTIAHVPTGFLTLTTGKMSSRKGNVLTGESLIADVGESAKERARESRADDKNALAEQIAVAALKYQILKQATGRNIIFDRERALSLEGDSGPYLQYAYARTCAIAHKAAAEGISGAPQGGAPLPDVARLIYRLPEVVARAAEEYEPHYLTNYLLELAASFNSWYAREQILDGTPLAAHKLAITEAVGATLRVGLSLLAIPAPEKM